MNGFILKMIEKNTKPPLWKRLYVPGGITFTQLSFIMDDMFSLPHENSFGFEFFNCKYQISEGTAYHFKRSRWQFSRRNADNTYIDDFLIPEPWFSYFRLTADGERAFRVEIEENFPGAMLPYPQVLKSKTIKGDSSWDPKGINGRLSKLYKITYEKKTAYPTHAQLCEAATEEGFHFVGCTNPVSAPMEVKDLSMSEMINHYLDRSGLREAILNNVEDFEKKQNKEHYELRWIERCDYAVGKLYGACPVDVFLRMCRKNLRVHLTDEEIESLYNQIPGDDRFTVRRGNTIVDSSLVENGSFRNLKEWHKWFKDIDYYIPTEDEINELWDYEYPRSNPVYRMIETVFRKDLHVKEEEIATYLPVIYDVFSYAGKIDKVMRELSREGMRQLNKREASIFSTALDGVSYYTRRAIFKGNRHADMPEEITVAGSTSHSATTAVFKGNAAAAAVLNGNAAAATAAALNGNVVSAAAAEALKGNVAAASAAKALKGNATASVAGTRANAAPKIYPNDPCPCGSGKKYKKCCGRK